jgi:heterotetrameric sarcosine oxidase gamma subunit
MLNASSALASAKPFVSTQLTIVEAPDFTLTQYAGAEKDLKKALGKLPNRIGSVQDNFLRVSPTQVWSLNQTVEAPNCFVTSLSSGRTRIEISGAPTRDVLAKCAAIDFHKREFKPGTFAMTGIHHVPVLIHCLDSQTFHLYVLRTFALSIWDHLLDAALEFK